MTLAFASPWLLGALGLLPILWWWLRLMPPAPRRIAFPPLFLLRGIDESRPDSSARPPWWLLVLRLLAAALVIVGAAGPMLHPPSDGGGGTLALVVDDGWAAARDWEARRRTMDEVLAEAARAGRAVLLLTTAPAADGATAAVAGPMTAADARTQVHGLEPKPWPVDRAAALRAVQALPRDRVIRVAWIADGVEDGQGMALAQALQSLGGGVTLFSGASGRMLLAADPAAGERPVLTVRRLAGQSGAEPVAVRALDGLGQVLVREEGRFAAGEDEVRLTLSLPSELRNRLARLEIEDEAGAAGVLLLDESWKRRLVGLTAGTEGAAPLLSPLHYLRQALEPGAEVLSGDLETLLERRPDALILADLPLAAAPARLDRWIAQGGVLIRFAGPQTAAALPAGGGTDAFYPVRLRAGGRSLGGAMSWTSPQGLAPFAAASPFHGLATAAEVSVATQVLADPDPTLADHVWAGLADGTPLVTAQPRGRGWVVLVHTSADPAWSNLALSGLYPEMLRRLVALTRGGQAVPGPLAPGEVLDGFGRRHPAAGLVTALPVPHDRLVPGPRNPPGLYGPAGGRVAFNLSPALAPPRPLAVPASIRRLPLDGGAAARDLAGPLLAAALALLIADLLIALALRGLLPRRGLAALALLGLALTTAEGRADDDFARRAALSTRLAFVRTGDGVIDAKTRSGLAALSQVVGQRSTARLDAPMAVDVEKDPVLFFPLLYWPLSAAQPPPSPAAIDKINAYMRAGGMVVLDSGAESATAPDPALAARLTGGLAIPPLSAVDGEHVLTRSFYLLKELPGRWDGPVWVAKGVGADHDGVSPVVVGGNDWAGAWATDALGRPSYPCVPGGERQRELAWRFGVNLVMYALTGNYKADQVHLPAILERLGR